jgi:putative transcriptional regulator
MAKKLTARGLARLEAERDIWREVLDGCAKSKLAVAYGFRLSPVRPSCERLKSGLTLVQCAALLGVSKRTLEQWEQGRRTPSGAAKTLLRVAELHPVVGRSRVDRAFAPPPRSQFG